MKVLRFEHGETFQTLGGMIHWVVWPKMGAKNVTMHYAVLEPGQTFASRHHEISEDVIGVVQGKGKLRSDEEELDIEAGMVIYVPEQEPHEVTNTGEVPLIMIGSQGPPDFDMYRRSGKL